MQRSWLLVVTLIGPNRNLLGLGLTFQLNRLNRLKDRPDLKKTPVEEQRRRTIIFGFNGKKRKVKKQEMIRHFHFLIREKLQSIQRLYLQQSLAFQDELYATKLLSTTTTGWHDAHAWTTGRHEYATAHDGGNAEPGRNEYEYAKSSDDNE